MPLRHTCGCSPAELDRAVPDQLELLQLGQLADRGQVVPQRQGGVEAREYAQHLQSCTNIQVHKVGKRHIAKTISREDIEPL
jgi:hypothetical protein